MFFMIFLYTAGLFITIIQTIYLIYLFTSNMLQNNNFFLKNRKNFFFDKLYSPLWSSPLLLLILLTTDIPVITYAFSYVIGFYLTSSLFRVIFIFYVIFQIYFNLNPSLITLLVYMELIIYLLVIYFALSIGSRHFSPLSTNISSILYPVILNNFISSWSLVVFINFYVGYFGVVNLTFMPFNFGFVTVFWFTVITLKLGIGPWYINSLILYKYINLKDICFYTYSYLIFILLPFISVYVVNTLTVVSVSILLISLFLQLEPLYFSTNFKSVLLYSTFLTYINILTFYITNV